MSLKTYQGVVDRFEGKLAVIKLDDGSEVLWPIKNLADDIKEGTTVKMTISTNQNEQKEKEELAKTILNDILNVSKDQSAD